MRLLLIILTALLAISVATNFYLYAELTVKDVQPEKPSITSQLRPAKSNTETVNPLEQAATEAFAKKQFDDALSSYIELNEQSPEIAESMRAEWFELILNSIRSRSAEDYLELVQAYLKVHPYDAQFLYLEIEYNRRSTVVTDTLSELFLLLRKPMSEELRRIVLVRIEEIYSHATLRLKEIEAWDILATMLESLMPLSPNNQTLLLDLAESYAMQQQFGLMEGVLAYLPRDTKQVQELRDIQNKANQPAPVRAQDAPGISLIRSGEHFIVEASISERHDVELLIDTGASTSVITQATFDALPGYINPEFVGNYTINTANGQVTAPVYRFASLAISDNYVDDIAIVVLPMTNFQADGLLGMNFLRAFRFEIDQRNSRLILAPYLT